MVLSPAAIGALRDLLDVNDDDETMLDAGLDPQGLAELRAIAYNEHPLDCGYCAAGEGSIHNYEPPAQH